MSAAPFLTAEQIFELNEKFGWFQYGDAQSDVSKAFAQEAIEKHERIRASAHHLLTVARAAAKAMSRTRQTDGGNEVVERDDADALVAALAELPSELLD